MLFCQQYQIIYANSIKFTIVVNNFGELMACNLTAGNTDDRKPVSKLVENLNGWLFGDKGYLGKDLWERLKAQSIEIFTKVKKNMQERFMNFSQKFYLSKRGVIETVIDQLKNIAQIEHSRHRKPANAFVNLIAGLIAYSLKPRKPSIKITQLAKINTNLKNSILKCDTECAISTIVNINSVADERIQTN